MNASIGGGHYVGETGGDERAVTIGRIHCGAGAG
ncbi:MAG: hypothetical protein RLZZ232_3384 [Planctomycetota bacterium]|jgi:hypothetical protein